MTGDRKFNFTFLEKKTCPVLENKDDAELLSKWGLKGCLKITYYNFDQEFHMYQKQKLIEDFFKDPSVYTTLKTVKNVGDQFKWTALGAPAIRVSNRLIPCSVTSMNFFSKLIDPDNEIVAKDGYNLTQCCEGYLNGIPIMDHLRCMLLLDDHPTYNLFTNYERQQFIFILFKHICLGGTLNQYEETVDPYLNYTRKLYKDLLSVERLEKNNEIIVRSIVIKPTAFGSDGRILCPEDSNNKQNFLYLIVDPIKRQITVLQCQLNGFVV